MKAYQRPIVQRVLLFTSIVCLSAACSHAADIIWQTPATISGPLDVSTLGTFFGSWAPYNSAAANAGGLTVNGVTFQANPDLPGAANTLDTGYGGYNSPGTSDANYNALLGAAAYQDNGNVVAISWNGMTVGHTYLVQFWVNDARSINVARFETLTGGANTSAKLYYGSDGSGPGQFVIGTFLADSASETISLNGYSINPDGNPSAQFNLIQVRDLGTPVTPASAATINWQAPAAISGPLDVSTLGTYFGSWAPHGAGALTVNGVTFQPSPDLPGAASSVDNGYGSYNSPGTSDTNYNTLLQAAAYQDNAKAVSISWNGMTVGNTYLVQLWVNDARSIGTTRFETVAGGASTSGDLFFGSDGSGPGQFVIGTFVANSAAETITLNSSSINPDGGPSAQFNLLQVRDLGVVTPPPTASLEWSANNNGVWDTGISTNWTDTGTSQPAVFNAGDQVLFDDTVGVPLTVILSGTVSPNVVTFNSSNNNFVVTNNPAVNGSGELIGPASLVKLGSSTLQMEIPNEFTGPVTIGGGTVQMNEPLSGSATTLGAMSGTIFVTNGATLAVNASGGYPAGNSGLSTRPIVISGAGVGGNGALRSVGNDIYHDGAPNGGLFRSLTLAGDATIGSGGRWDLGQEGLLTEISTAGSNYNLTCLQGGYSEWHEVTLDPNLGNIDYILGSANTWNVDGMGAGLGNPTNILTLHPGVTMNITHDANNNADSGYAKIIHVQNGASFNYRPSGGPGDYHLDTVLQLDSGANWNFFNADGGNGTGVLLDGAITLNGPTHLQIGDSPITVSSVISGPGGFVLDNYNHVLTFSASNTYSGATIIGGGRTLALLGSGAISQSSLIFLGGTDPTAVALDVSGRPDDTLTLAGGETLSGIGAINGNLAVSAGGIIAPSGTNTTLGITAGSNPTGTIAASGNVTLNGTTTLKLNGSGVNDVIQSTGGSITYGGTLNLVNVSGSPLAAGDSFPLFLPGSPASFSTITPATPGPGLTWDTTQLASGILGVVAGGTLQPVIAKVGVSGGNLVFSGTNGLANTGFYVLSATNLATPVTKWNVISTNKFDNNGAFNVTNAISPGVPIQFFLLELQ